VCCVSEVDHLSQRCFKRICRGGYGVSESSQNKFGAKYRRAGAVESRRGGSHHAFKNLPIV